MTRPLFAPWRVVVLSIAFGGLLLIVAHTRGPADPPLPRASDFQRVVAQFAIARDGSAITIRSTALDSLRICVEPTLASDAPTRCFTAGAIRRGEATR